MDFYADQRLTITKTITELIDSSGGSVIVLNKSHGEEIPEKIKLIDGCIA